MSGSHPAGTGLEGKPHEIKAGAAGALYTGDLCTALSVCCHTESGQKDVSFLESGRTAVQSGGLCGYERNHSGAYLAY